MSYPNSQSCISLNSISFSWPHGDLIFNHLSLTLNQHSKYGLVGVNGVGKSTLARLIIGTVAPTQGKINHTNIQVAYLAQNEIPGAETLANYLGNFWQDISPPHRDIAQNLEQQLNLSTQCNQLSGGEWTKARLLKLLTQPANFIVLDEPTNNLDRDAKDALLNLVKRIHCGLLIISHDRELLEYVDTIVELSNQGITTYGGNWCAYESARSNERLRQQEQLKRTKLEQAQAQHALTAAQERQERRMHRGMKNAAKNVMPKIVAQECKRRSQNTLGKLNLTNAARHQQKAARAKATFLEAKIEPTMYAQISQPEALPSKKLIFAAHEFNFAYADHMNKHASETFMWQRNINYSMHGAKRLAIHGKNGAGKTTFLRLLLRLLATGAVNTIGKAKPDVVFNSTGSITIGTGITYQMLDQQLSLLDDSKSIMENLIANITTDHNPTMLRNLLAQFLFSHGKIHQPVATLSGGERLRATLARIFSVNQTGLPQLLILDEPTNNLDLYNIEFLENVLSNYNGAIIVASHDKKFLENIGIEDNLTLE
jgi:ATPase subunit of ABC transporter with duplicated ATPase domains